MRFQLSPKVRAVPVGSKEALTNLPPKQSLIRPFSTGHAFREEAWRRRCRQEEEEEEEVQCQRESNAPQKKNNAKKPAAAKKRKKSSCSEKSDPPQKKTNAKKPAATKTSTLDAKVFGEPRNEPPKPPELLEALEEVVEGDGEMLGLVIAAVATAKQHMHMFVRDRLQLFKDTQTTYVPLIGVVPPTTLFKRLLTELYTWYHAEFRGYFGEFWPVRKESTGERCFSIARMKKGVKNGKSRFRDRLPPDIAPSKREKAHARAGKVEDDETGFI